MDFIDQIRQNADIINLASQYTTLRKRGTKYVGLCPFHSEKTPSFTIDPEKQLYHCFGCGVGGDIFTLIMEKENLSFPETLKHLAQKYNIPLPQKKKLSPQLLKLEEKLYKINEDALAFFKKNLFNTEEGKKAIGYLQERHISDEIIQKFKIGYALNSWDSLISFFQRKKVSPKILEKAGLVIFNPKKNSYYDRFRGRIIFPIFNLSGKVIAFGGRSIINSDPKYLNSPDTLIFSKRKLLYGINFSKELIRNKGKVIFLEGYTDFISLYKEGITNIAASLGTSLTTDQISLALRFGEKIFICYDSDPAGIKATKRAVSLCLEKGAPVNIIVLPKGSDPDSTIHRYGKEAFNKLINNSIPGLKFLINSLLEEYNINIPEEKSKIARNIVNILVKVPDSIIRSEYFKQSSEWLSIDEKLLRSMAEQKYSPSKTEGNVFFLPAEKRLLQILLEEKSLAPYIFAEIEEEDYKRLKSKDIFQIFIDDFKNGILPSFNKLKDKIDKNLLSTLSKMLLEKEQTSSLEEALDCLYALKQYAFENRLLELTTEIAKLKNNDEAEKRIVLQREKHEIFKQLNLLSKQKY